MVCSFQIVPSMFAWGDMDALLADRDGSEVLKKVVKNWLEMTGPYQALDLPTQLNDKCPYSYDSHLPNSSTFSEKFTVLYLLVLLYHVL